MGRDDVTPGAVVSIQTFGNLADLNPHIHMIVSWGCFDNRGTFYAVREVPDNDMIEQLFRHRVFSMLLEEDAVTEDLVENMLAGQQIRKSRSRRQQAHTLMRLQIPILAGFHSDCRPAAAGHCSGKVIMS